MKNLSLIIIATLSLLFYSCNNNNEPNLEIDLRITESYLPVSVEFNKNDYDDEQKRQLIHLVNNDHIINDVSDIPDDPIGLNDAFGIAFGNINFKEFTLLIKYIFNDYTIDTYSNRYYRNTKENTYNWTIDVGSASVLNVDSDTTRFTRFAILVKKLPEDAKVKTWYGLTDLGWNPFNEQ